MAGCLLFQNSFKLVARMILKVMEQQIIKVKSSKQNQQARHIRYRQKNATTILFPSSMMSGFLFKFGMVSTSPKPSLSMRV